MTAASGEAPGWDVDGICNDHGKWLCADCALPETSAPASGGAGRDVFPDRIGQLQLGENLSDGDDRMCAGGCSKPIPAGHAVYWPDRMGEYPDDVDPSCIACAIDKTEREQGYCSRCDFADEFASPPPAADAVLKAVREAIVLIDELNERKPSRAFYGINQTLHAKLATVRATLARPLAATGKVVG